jgi:hypothetical protein
MVTIFFIKPVCGPLYKREDGTVVFASPIGDGHIPMISLQDLGWWVRYTLDHREETSGKDLQVASDLVGWDYLSETFTKVTGIPSVHKRLTLDRWFDCVEGTDRPIASENKIGDGSTTIRQTFSGFWSMLRDDVLRKDMDWVRSIHPNGHTLESWIRETGYVGKLGCSTALKNTEDGKGRIFRNSEVCRLL